MPNITTAHLEKPLPGRTWLQGEIVVTKPNPGEGRVVRMWLSAWPAVQLHQLRTRDVAPGLRVYFYQNHGTVIPEMFEFNLDGITDPVAVQRSLAQMFENEEVAAAMMLAMTLQRGCTMLMFEPRLWFGENGLADTLQRFFTEQAGLPYQSTIKQDRSAWQQYFRLRRRWIRADLGLTSAQRAERLARLAECEQVFVEVWAARTPH